MVMCQKGNVNVAMQLIAKFVAENNFMAGLKHRCAYNLMFLGIDAVN